MPKGKWFLTYIYDWIDTSPLCHSGGGTITEHVDLGENITDENQAIEIAQAKWDEIISHYPNGKKDVSFMGEYINPRNPQVVYRVFGVVFSNPPKVPDTLGKLPWL